MSTRLVVPANVTIITAWNKLVDQPWRIMSLGLRLWAHEF